MYCIGSYFVNYCHCLQKSLCLSLKFKCIWTKKCFSHHRLKWLYSYMLNIFFILSNISWLADGDRGLCSTIIQILLVRARLESRAQGGISVGQNVSKWVQHNVEHTAISLQLLVCGAPRSQVDWHRFSLRMRLLMMLELMTGSWCRHPGPRPLPASCTTTSSGELTMLTFCFIMFVSL